MESQYLKEDKQLIFKINEDIDECVAQKIRRKLDNEIERYMPRKIIFDFSNVQFMDSAGIGMVLGRYKMMKMLGGKLEMVNVSPMLRKVFEMSGITKICPIIEAS